MQFAQINNKEIKRLYNEECYSIRELGRHFGVTPIKIRKALEFLGVPIKDKSQIQKEKLASGKVAHPTKGKQRKESVKRKISKTVAENWSNISDAERERRSKLSKQQWDNMSESDRAELQRAAHEAIRDAAENGSKLERFVKNELEKNGYDVKIHYQGITRENPNLEVDLFLPDLNIVIEIDGPSHFLPIWGQDRLESVMKSDNEKSGLLLKDGFIVLRVKCMCRNVSLDKSVTCANMIIDKLNEIEGKKLTRNKRFIEMELE